MTMAQPVHLPHTLPPSRAVHARARAGRVRRVRFAWCAAIVAALALGAGVHGAGANTTTTTTGAKAAAWDPQLEPIARAVERIRGLTFDHPVAVQYLDDAAFDKRLAVDEGDLTDKERADIKRSEAQLRAIGLVGPDVDLLAATSDLEQAGVLAYYSPKTQKVTVRGTQLDVAHKVTLAHELTHALQDQHFDLNKLDREAQKAHADVAESALVEGDAVHVERAYLDSLPQRDQAAYSATQNADTQEFQDKVDAADVPAALEALFESPYALGPDMVRFVEAVGGDKALNDLFAKPPRSELAFLDPSTVVDHVDPLRVVAPKLDSGEVRVGPRDTFGAFALYLMLSTTMDPAAAFHATQGWGGDAMVTFSRGDQTCVRTTFTGRDAETSTALLAAVRQWSSNGAHPSSTVTDRGQSTTLTACDERGASVDPGDAPTRALVTAALRSTVLAEVTEVSSPKVGVCAADGALRSPAFTAVRNAAVASPSAEPAPDVLDRFQRSLGGIVTDCRNSV
ncbi:MAG: hypothetical protein ACHQIG_02660 [Acidimicrobiia bacterium]